MRAGFANPAAHGWLRLVALLMAVAAAFALCLPAQARQVPVPAMTSRVVDLTKTLNAEDASSLREDISTIEQLTQAQLAVLIVPTTGEDSIEQFATRVFAQWKLGRQDENDGVLLLVALKDRRMRIEVGTGLEGRITDIQAARIIDGEMMPRFRNGDFAGGVKAAVQSLSELISAPQLQVVDEEPQAEPRDKESSLLHRVIDAFSTESSQSRINMTLLAVMLWTIGVGVWHGSRPRPAAPRAVSQGSGKRGRKGRRVDAHRAQREGAGALWADLKTEPPSPDQRRWPTVLGLLAAGPVGATLALMNLAMPFVLFMPVGFMYGVGYLSGRFKTARYVFICIALAIAGLIGLGFYLGADKVPWIVAGVLATGIVGIGLAVIVAGVRVHWKRGVLGFMVRLALVTGVIGFAFVQLRPGPDPDETWLVMALVSFIALVFGFFPATGNGSGGDDDDRDSGWSSSSSSSSGSSSSDSSSSSSGGSSSGGGASGSW
ncbi:TPM domain-containing protein [Variovorax sp.]|uniref:TPM domain-containing protein n=1 Tax=Variovorax sp. TaxID=1871043 RepID=UPI003BAD28CD